jgi:hypothetical protein
MVRFASGIVPPENRVKKNPLQAAGGRVSVYSAALGQNKEQYDNNKAYKVSTSHSGGHSIFHFYSPFTI